VDEGRQSNGPGTAPTAFWTNLSRSYQSCERVTATPPITSEWPLRYFVVECTMKSAPSSKGLWLAGVANVLSTATSAFRRRASTPSMSTTFSRGFVGLSTQISRVSSRIASSRARRSVWSTRVVAKAPVTEHLVDQSVGASVQVGRQHDVRPGFADGGDHRVLGREAGRERDRGTALEVAERLLQRSPRWVGRPRVVVVVDELPGCFCA